MQINTELPIFKPQLGEFGGGKPPKEYLPRVWANESSEAVLIHKQLMDQSAQQFDEECWGKFQRRSPLCIQNEDHNGFALMTKLELHSFNDRPAELWDSDMLEPFELTKINKKIRIGPMVLATAKSKAAGETRVLEPTNQP